MAEAERLALLALGSNLGDREATLEAALARLDSPPRTRVLGRSRWIETEPVGGPPQGPYLNGAAVLAVQLDPLDLLARLLEVEVELGRVRGERNGPRTIDLDLLLVAGGRGGPAVVLETPELQLPHPRMLERGFVLEPACEVAPGWVHPITGRTLREHREELRARGGPRSSRGGA